jgi:predicted nucleotidyltransferase
MVVMELFQSFFKALNHDNVRYVVVGGLAVVLHGHLRLTADVDLVVDLEPEAAANTIDVLTRLGLRPRVPVRAEAFADARERQRWIEERGMQVFTMFDPKNPLRSVDLFVDLPVPFEELWNRSEMIRLPETEVRVASIPDIISMKKMAGRPQDLEDIKALEALIDERRRNPS